MARNNRQFSELRCQVSNLIYVHYSPDELDSVVDDDDELEDSVDELLSSVVMYCDKTSFGMLSLYFTFASWRAVLMTLETKVESACFSARMISFFQFVFL